MLDWYCIEYLYPSAFKKFNELMFPNIGVLSISTLETYDIKKLYRFFDKQEIFLTLEMYNPNHWVYTISLTNGGIVGPTQFSKESREDIEKEGFIECFKLLDKKLSNH